MIRLYQVALTLEEIADIILKLKDEYIYVIGWYFLPVKLKLF